MTVPIGDLPAFGIDTTGQHVVDSGVTIANLTAAGKDLKLFGAVGDGVTDDTAAINAAFAAGVPLVVSPGTYKVSAINILLNNASLVGSGPSCNFVASGSNGNIFTIGVAGNIIDGVTLRNFRITSASARGSGAAILAHVLQNSNFIDLKLDGGNLYNGIELAEFGSVRFTGVRIDHCLNDGLRAYGGPIGGVQLVLDPSTFITYSAHDGIVIGGGVGGLEADCSVFAAGRYGIYFTSALNIGGAAINREIFIGPFFEVDTCVIAGAYFDTGSAAIVICNGGWFASCTTGPGCQIQGSNGIFNFSGCSFHNNHTSGLIENNVAGTLLVTGARVTNNGLVAGGDGITVNAGGALHNSLISNNFINSNGTVPNGYGIRFTGSSGSVIVIGNYLFGNAQGGMLAPTAGNYVAQSRTEQNYGYNFGATSPVAPGASPYTYTAGLTREMVYVGGGTLSALSVNGQSTGTGTNLGYKLGPGETMTITYTVAPTLVVTKD